MMDKKQAEQELLELEAKDIEKALKGDWGARLRVEVVLPFIRILEDLGPAMEKVIKQNPGLSHEECHKLPSVQKVVKDLNETFSTQILALICFTSLPTDTLIQKMLHFNMILNEIERSVSDMLLKSWIEEKSKK